jgi:hypothetical protein
MPGPPRFALALALVALLLRGAAGAAAAEASGPVWLLGLPAGGAPYGLAQALTTQLGGQVPIRAGAAPVGASQEARAAAAMVLLDRAGAIAVWREREGLLIAVRDAARVRSWRMDVAMIKSVDDARAAALKIANLIRTGLGAEPLADRPVASAVEPAGGHAPAPRRRRARNVAPRKHAARCGRLARDLLGGGRRAPGLALGGTAALRGAPPASPPFVARDTLAYPRSVVQAAFALPLPGSVSGPVQSERGFHVLKLIARRRATTQPLSQVEGQIRDASACGGRRARRRSRIARGP